MTGRPKRTDDIILRIPTLLLKCVLGKREGKSEIYSRGQFDADGLDPDMNLLHSLADAR